MLTEDAVVDAVRDYLIARGWEIVSRATAIQRGYDLVAQRGDERLVIEAKGAGSSKPGTARYGQEFDKGQVFDHVAKAILKALRVASAGTALAGIALPDNEYHRIEVAAVQDALFRLGIAVFWVAEDGVVTVAAPWQP